MARLLESQPGAEYPNCDHVRYGNSLRVLAKTSRFVCIFFLVVVCGLIVKLSQTLFWP